MGRPTRVFDYHEVARHRDQERLSWSEIARRIGAGGGTAVWPIRDIKSSPQPFQNSSRSVFETTWQ